MNSPVEMKTSEKEALFSKRRVMLTLKLAFVVLVFWFLARKDLISFAVLNEAFLRPKETYLAAFLLVVSFFIGGIRFYLLLRAEGYRIGGREVLKLHVVGQFFNIALPGAVSGDLVKSFYLKKYAHRSGSHALGILLFDRIVGLSAMILTATIALYSPLIGDADSKTVVLRSAFTALSIGTVVFYAYLFIVTEKVDPFLNLLNALEKRFPALSKAKGLYLGVKTFHHHRMAVLLALVISFVIQTLVCASCYTFAIALGETQLHQIQFYAIAPIGLLVTAIPILPGGVGTGHAAFSLLFKWIGSVRGADIFSLYAVFQILIGAVCGLYYLRFKQDTLAHTSH